MINVIQSAVATDSLPIPGGDLGPGTIGMQSVTATFANPLTNGNLVVVALSGNVPTIGNNLNLGPRSLVQLSGSGSNPTTTYYVASTLVDSVGRETQLGPVGSLSVLTGQQIQFLQPNPNSFSSPGWVTWNAYIGLTPTTLTKQNTVPLNPTDQYFMVTLIAGANPPITPIHDTLGLTYKQVIFVPGGTGASIVGSQMMAFYFASAVAGSNTITFVCSPFNTNPLFGVPCDLDMIIGEFTPGNTNNFLASDFIQQAQAAFDIKINLTDSSSISRTTDFNNQAQKAGAAGVISPSVGTDYFLSLLTGDFTLNNPAAVPFVPPTLTGLTYVPVNNVTSYNKIGLYLWISYRNVVVAPGGFYVRES